MKHLKVRWTGFRPLVMHNVRLADPTNPLVRAIKKITSKGTRKMTDADYVELYRLEFIGGLYYDEKLGPCLPDNNILGCIRSGARRSRRGADIEAGVLVTEPLIPVEYKGPRDADSLYARLAEFSLREAVVVNKMRTIRVRPMFPRGWQVNFELEYDESLLNQEALVQYMVDAGCYSGLGDKRPRCGRFTVEIHDGDKFVEVK